MINFHNLDRTFGCLIFCVGLTTSFCNSPNTPKSSNDLGFKSEFTPSEIHVIQEFVDYLDSNVACFQYHSNSLNIYNVGQDGLQESELDKLTSELNNRVNLKHFKTALAILDSGNVFDTFWEIRRVHFPFEGRDGYELKYNTDGKFFGMLRRLSEKEEVISEYLELSIPEGELTPGMIALIFNMTKQNIDFHSDANKLVWKIHYITLLSQMNRDFITSFKPN